MGIFTLENRIKCGNCGTEFDFNRNTNGCPLCSFGSKKTVKEELKTASSVAASMGKVNYLAIPPELKLKSGDVNSDRETETWGSWLMFNDFFAPKFLARVLAWRLSEKKTEVVILKEFMASIVQIIKDKTSLRNIIHFSQDITKEAFNEPSDITSFLNKYHRSQKRLVLLYHYLHIWYKNILDND